MTHGADTVVLDANLGTWELLFFTVSYVVVVENA